MHIRYERLSRHHSRNTLLRATAVLLLLGAASVARAEAFEIDVDEGTVNVRLASTQMSEPYEISSGPQGSCVPEVSIERTAAGATIRHTKNCHGTGRNQGTVFTLTLSASNSYVLKLKAGRVNLDGSLGAEGFSSFKGDVSVGGIKNHRRDLEVDISRHLLLGANAGFMQENNAGQLVTIVTYGQIDIL